MIPASSPFFLALAFTWVAIYLQGMGVVRYALPLVPEDKEIHAQNRARNEEQHRQQKEKKKKKKKKKKANKAKKAEASAKGCREAEKAGLHEHKSSETLVSEVEGEEDSHWLNKLLDEEEDEEVPAAGGGTEASGGSETPKGSRIPGGAEGAPYIIVDNGGDEAPQGDSDSRCLFGIGVQKKTGSGLKVRVVTLPLFLVCRSYS